MITSGADMVPPPARITLSRMSQAGISQVTEVTERADGKRAESEQDMPLPAVPTPAGAHLFAARTVLLFGEVTSALAERVNTALIALAEVSDAPIRMLVHSPGGHVEAADSIHDVVRFIAPEVHMIGTGWVASAGALVFVAAKPERRFALANTRFLLHQPLGGVSGVASDVEIEARQILRARERINRIFARETGQSYDKIVADTQRNFWMNAAEACAYGLVARVIDRHDEI